MGALCRATRQGRGILPRSLLGLWAAGQRHVARDPAGGGYGRAFGGMDPRPDGRVLPRSRGPGRDDGAERSGSVYWVAEPGTGLQDRTEENSGTARKSKNGAGPEIRHSRV